MDGPSREMTLEEYMNRLPPLHEARQGYVELVETAIRFKDIEDSDESLEGRALYALAELEKRRYKRVHVKLTDVTGDHTTIVELEGEPDPGGVIAGDEGISKTYTPRMVLDEMITAMRKCGFCGKDNIPPGDYRLWPCRDCRAKGVPISIHRTKSDQEEYARSIGGHDCDNWRSDLCSWPGKVAGDDCRCPCHWHEPAESKSDDEDADAV